MKLHKNADAQSLIAEIHISRRNYSVASGTLSAGETLFPKDARFVGLAGVVALKRCDYEHAKQLLEKALLFDPTNCNFRYFLALCYSPLDLRESDGVYVLPPKIDAMQVVELCKVPAANNRFLASKPAVLLMLADAYKSLGDYTDAEKSLQKLISLSPGLAQSWQCLAEVYAAEKLWQRSAYCWSKAAELKNATVVTLLKEANRSIKANDPVGTLTTLQYLLEIDPANSAAQYLLKKMSKADVNARKIYDLILTDQQITKYEVPPTFAAKR